jgi:hypothetical protein
MNPARAFGPAVVEWSWDDHCTVYNTLLCVALGENVVGVCSFRVALRLLEGVWWVGPIVGGVVAGVTYEYLFMQRKHGRYASQIQHLNTSAHVLNCVCAFAPTRPRGVPSTSGDNHRHKKKRKIK